MSTELEQEPELRLYKCGQFPSVRGLKLSAHAMKFLRVSTDRPIAKIIALFKGGSIVDRASMYRPISLLQALYKIFTSLIDTRLRQGLVERLHPQQFGFLKGNSVDNAIFGLLRA